MRKEEIEKYATSEIINPPLYKFHLYSSKIYLAAFAFAGDYRTLSTFNAWRLVQMADLFRWKSMKDLNVTILIDGDLISNITPLI